MRTSFKTLVSKKRRNMAVAPNLWVTVNLCKKYLQVITWNKKHSSKQVVSMIYTLGKEVFAAATFKGLRDVSFQTE